MSPRATKIAPLKNPRYALLRRIPSVDEILNAPEAAPLIALAGRDLVITEVRQTLADLRKTALSAKGNGAAAGAVERQSLQILETVAARIRAAVAPSLRPVINATGVILHTNLGRAPLSLAAIERIAAIARYSNLEYDISTGRRGKRDIHTSLSLTNLAGAEAAIVVNNNAAAVFLALNTFARDAEVIVSRGELIEIGDGFRIPEIMAASGAHLREVGTTNRTRLADYECAINERTRMLLRVHPSNFKIVGFSNRPDLAELVALGRKRRIPVFEDLGSGCLADLSGAGIAEPLVRESLAAGAGIVCFSGDKLLGGPQGGIIAGRKKFIQPIRRNPLFRALRVDKLTIAALEATLTAYRRGALDEIPALRMIRFAPTQIEARASAFIENLRHHIDAETALELRDGFSVIGGGSTPEQKLPTKLIAVRRAGHSAAQLENRLRQPDSQIPVIARIEKDMLVIDLRTVFEEEEGDLRAALVAALSSPKI